MREKESTVAPAEFDGSEDKDRKDFHRKGARPKGHSGKMGMRHHKRSKRRR